MKRILRFLSWTVVLLVVLSASLVIYLRNADLSVYETQIENYLSSKIGHTLDIDGRFNLQVRGGTRLSAESVSLVNANWQGESQLLAAAVGDDHYALAVDFQPTVDQRQAAEADAQGTRADEAQDILAVDHDLVEDVAVELDLVVEHADELAFEPLTRGQLDPVVTIIGRCEVAEIGCAVRRFVGGGPTRQRCIRRQAEPA